MHAAAAQQSLPVLIVGGGPVGLAASLSSVSTLDLLGSGFTVLTGRDGIAWTTAASEVAGHFEVTVGRYVVGDPGLEDERNAFLESYGITSAGAVLICPDGYIAWRGAGSAADPLASLTDAIGRILGR